MKLLSVNMSQPRAIRIGARDVMTGIYKEPVAGRVRLVRTNRGILATADLRRELIDRWHEEIRTGIDVDRAVGETEGWSFAELEELKNLLILLQMDSGAWDWDAAVAQYEQNRNDLAVERKRAAGFHWNGHATVNGMAGA